MPQVRLIGLVLFTTTVFLAMAAAVTKTTHIRFKKPTRDASGNIVPEWRTSDPQFPGTLPEGAADSVYRPTVDDPLQFVAVPVVYPLAIAGAVGLLMWFVPAPLGAAKPARTKRRRRRK